MDKGLIYLLLICALMIVPRGLQRFRLPAPMTCFLIGMLLLVLMPGHRSSAVHLSAVLGITTLFLYAGLETDLRELAAQRGPLLRYLLVRLAGIGLFAAVAIAWLDLPWQAALLLALAVLTSSTGFIIDSLDRFDLDAGERFWVTNQAIAGELLALALMFVVLQAGDPMTLAVSTGVLLALVVLMPLAYIALARWILPHAPGSEFSLLVTVAIVAAYVTDKLGVEFLLGAFLAGLSARLLQRRMRWLSTGGTMHAVKLFSNFFMPFYFFRQGAQVPPGAFGWEALAIGLALSLLLPLRLWAVYRQRRRHGDNSAAAWRVAMSLSPTLIFTLVLAQILHERFAIPEPLFGGLLIYAGINTLLPSLVLRNASDPTARRSQEIAAAPPQEP